MIIWLDHLIFGNGRGIKSPGCNDQYFWLKDINTGKSEFYLWNGWSGCQLTSFQWRMPKIVETRWLLNREFRVFSAKRTCGRVQIAWKMDLQVSHQGYCEKVQELYDEIHKI